MKTSSAILLICSLTLAACRDNKPVPVAIQEKPAPSLVGTHVSISLNRAAMGLSLEKPISREAGTINGVETSITGYVQKETEHFLVLSRHPVQGQEKEHDESLLWIPYSSILTIRQQHPNSRGPVESADQPDAWRLDAVQGLMNLIGFDLTQVPEGTLEIWVERNGKKDFMDDVDTHPGHEQWLYFGIDPYKTEALMMSVVSEEDRGSGIVFLPLDDPKPFQKMIGPDHDWKKSAVIAAENSGAGAGKIYARLTPAK